MAVSFLPLTSEAQTTQTWLNSNLSNVWSTVAPNWDAGVAWTNGNDASFTGTAETVDISGAVTVNSILFGSTGWIVADAISDGTLTLVGEGRITTAAGLNTIIGATISEDIAGGNLIKAGDTVLVLSGTNTYTGTTTVEKGTLQLNNGAALGATSGVTVNSGGAVGLFNGVTVSGVSITINGGGAGDNFGALKAMGSGTSVWAGNVIIGSGSTRVGATQADSVLEISGVISGSQALNVRTNDGGGVVLLTNAGNTYSGDTAVIGGILKVGVTNALPTGTKVVLGNTTGLPTAPATLDLNGFNQRVAGVTAVAGNTVMAKVTNTSATAAVLTVDYSSASPTPLATGNASIAGNLSLVKTGTGIFALSSVNTYTGATTVDGGTLQIENAGALGGTSGVTVNSGSLALNNVTVSGVSISIASTDSFGGLKSVGSGTSVWTGNVFIGNANARVGANAGTVLEIAGAISGVAGSGFTVRTDNTGGTVLLSNANNTYTGTTSVIAGVLKVGVVDALPTDTTVNLGNGSNQGFATFDLNGFDQRVAGVTAATNNTVVAMVTNTSGTASVLTVDSAATVATNTAFITGNLSLVKDGTGIFRLTSANTYTGSTTVNLGTLEISGVLGSISGQEFILNGGTLLINNNSTAGANNNNRISDTSTITFRDGDLTFTGSADASTNSSETIGNVVLDRGYQTVRITYGGTNASTLTASGITRSAGGGVVFLTGTNLGASSAVTTSVSRFFVNNAPTLIGTTDALSSGVNSAVKNTKIVPYLVGSSTGSTTAPDTFVTYNSDTGFRPLDPNSEFTQNLINATTVGHNTRITASLTMGASTNVAINSLIVQDPIASSGTDTTLNLNGNTVTVTSGAILFDSNTSTITGGTLAFGSQEAIIYAHGGTSTISSRITGSGGLTVAGTGTFVLNASNSNYSGDTTLLSGITVIGNNSTGLPGAVTQGPLGTGNLVFAGGAVRTTQGAGTRTVGNNIIFKADTTLSSGGAAAGMLVFSGSMTLRDGDRVLTNNAPNTTTFSGAIGEDGQKRGITVTTATANTGAVIFSGTNTYTGDTKVAGLATLLVNGTHNTGSAYNVASGATLGGGGTIGVAAGGSVTIAGGGTLSVGNGAPTPSAATLTITTTAGGALTFTDSTSIVRLDIFSDASAGTGSDMSGDATRADRLVVSGNTNLNGAHLILGTVGANSLTFSEGDRWKIFDWVTAFPTGAFTINPAADLPALAAGLKWDYSDLYNGGTIAVAVVPEPSRVVLLTGGLMVAVLRRRRRN